MNNVEELMGDEVWIYPIEANHQRGYRGKLICQSQAFHWLWNKKSVDFRTNRFSLDIFYSNSKKVLNTKQRAHQGFRKDTS